MYCNNYLAWWQAGNGEPQNVSLCWNHHESHNSSWNHHGVPESLTLYRLGLFLPRKSDSDNDITKKWLHSPFLSDVTIANRLRSVETGHYKTITGPQKASLNCCGTIQYLVKPSQNHHATWQNLLVRMAGSRKKNCAQIWICTKIADSCSVDTIK